MISLRTLMNCIAVVGMLSIQGILGFNSGILVHFKDC
jgi:hypothetical protein